MLSIVFSVMDFFISELKKKHVNFYGVHDSEIRTSFIPGQSLLNVFVNG